VPAVYRSLDDGKSGEALRLNTSAIETVMKAELNAVWAAWNNPKTSGNGTQPRMPPR
jgi:hypothetical protein